jgi:GT2 family glycosyltransferase
MEIAALLTCHNRREKTLACLESLFRQARPDGCDLDVYLVDDGSTDGTSEAVRSEYPSVHLIAGDGQLYWNGGMRRAFSAAQSRDPDFYLWLNDDVTLYENALLRLLSTCEELVAEGEEAPIIVGTMQDPVTHETTYGGVRRCNRWHPMKYQYITPSDQPLPCDTFNGNCVLICRDVARRVGNLDSAFTHAMGDYDYGLRGRRLGCSCWVAPGFTGACSRNENQEKNTGRKLSFRELRRYVSHSKGFPMKEYAYFLRRHGGALWFVFWAMPYFRLILTRTFPVLCK